MSCVYIMLLSCVFYICTYKELDTKPGNVKKKMQKVLNLGRVVLVLSIKNFKKVLFLPSDIALLQSCTLCYHCLLVTLYIYVQS